VPRDVTPMVGEVIDGHLVAPPQPQPFSLLRDRVARAADEINAAATIVEEESA